MLAIALAALSGIALAGDSAASPPQLPALVHRAPTSAADSSAQDSMTEDTPAEITPEQHQFGERMVAAIRKKDVVELKKLVAPEALACFDQSRQAYLNSWLKKHFRYSIPERHRLSVAKLSLNASIDSKFRTYPVAPTYVLEIQFNNAERGDITLNRMIGQQDGKWYETAPCPTQLGMDRLNKVKSASSQSTEARAKEAYARVDESLAARIRAYLAKNDQANAWKLAAESLNVDIGTARQVVAMLASAKPH
ncbi:MAG: hypothetical protein Q7S58_15290 [Candidatus Binatus sp.]|nr:hypothetical protein [Candidatus Binatus sp.]